MLSLLLFVVVAVCCWRLLAFVHDVVGVVIVCCWCWLL